MDDELELFKREINLSEYAARELGYSIDYKRSSRNGKSIAMENAGGDKIVVTVDQRGDGHWVYFSVFDRNDNGSIVDFVRHRKGLSLGHIRKELRPWVKGEIQHSSKKYVPRIKKQNRPDVQRTLKKMKLVHNHRYLEIERCIDVRILRDNRFYGIILQDIRGNAVFPHVDSQGEITGYEIRGEGFKGFSDGGKKGLWQSNNLMSADEIVITESAIEALSHAELKNNAEETAYTSIAGALSKRQILHLKDLIGCACQKDAKIRVATNKDDGGYSLAQEIKNIAPKSAKIKRSVPRHATDWNDELKYRKRRKQPPAMAIYNRHHQQ